MYNYYSRYKGLLSVLYGYTILRGIGRSGFMILFPLYVLSIGYTTAELGGIATYASALVLIILPFTGYLIDKGWSREILFISGIGMGLALILPVIYRSYFSLVVSFALSSLSLLLWSPSRNRLIGLVIPSTYMGRVYSLFIVMFNTSRIFTSFSIGRLTYLGYDKLMLIIGFISLIGSLLTYLAIIRVFHEERTSGIDTRGFFREYIELFKLSRNILPLVLFSLIDSFAWRLWFPMLNAYLKQYLGLTDPEIGDYNTIMSIAMLITAYIAGHITDVVKPVRALVIYELIGVFGVLFLLTGKPLVFISAGLIGFSISFWVSAYNTLITIIRGVSQTGKLRALTDTIRSISGVPAPRIGGLLLGLNQSYPFMLSSILMVSAIFILKYVKHGE